jgi:hypothetical protein
MRITPLISAALLFACAVPLEQVGVDGTSLAANDVDADTRVEVDVAVLDVWTLQDTYNVGDLLDVTVHVANLGTRTATFQTRVRMISENEGSQGFREGLVFGDEATLTPGSEMDIFLDLGEVLFWEDAQDVSLCHYQAQIDVYQTGTRDVDRSNDLFDSGTIVVDAR